VVRLYEGAVSAGVPVLAKRARRFRLTALVASSSPLHTSLVPDVRPSSFPRRQRPSQDPAARRVQQMTLTNRGGASIPRS